MMIRDTRPHPALPGRRTQTVEAVRGIDLDVAEGELVAFLGPNGAGKSTTLRMLTTLLQPDVGHRRGGRARRRRRARRRAAADRLHRPGQRRRPHPAGPRRAGQPGPLLRARPARGAGPGRDELLAALDLERPRRPHGQHPVGRPAAAPRHRHGHGAPPGAAVPRRAVDRARPAEPGQPARSRSSGCGPTTARPSCSPRTTSTRPTPSPTGWWSSTTAGSSPTTRPSGSSPTWSATASSSRAADEPTCPPWPPRSSASGGATRCESSGTVVTARVHGGAARAPRAAARSSTGPASTSPRPRCAGPRSTTSSSTLTGRSLREAPTRGPCPGCRRGRGADRTRPGLRRAHHHRRPPTVRPRLLEQAS